MNAEKKTITLTIDGQKVTASAGDSILEAALANGIYIPNLCYIAGKQEPSASCRLCFVEIEGESEPVTACTREVSQGLKVNTKGEKALQLAQAGFELLMASHPVDCAHCSANRACELQKIAKHLGCKLKPKHLRPLLRDLPIDESNPAFTLDPNKCVLCGRCVWVCHLPQHTPLLGFAYRGFNRVVTTFYSEPIGERCRDCGECIDICPTGALSFKKD